MMMFITLFYLHNIFYLPLFSHFTIFPLIHTFITHIRILPDIPFKIITYSIENAADPFTFNLINIKYIPYYYIISCQTHIHRDILNNPQYQLLMHFKNVSIFIIYDTHNH